MTMNRINWAEVEAFIAERKPVEVDAGILNDWFWTAATVWTKKDGWLDKGAAFTHSTWALPGFKATMKNGDVIERAAFTVEPQ